VIDIFFFLFFVIKTVAFFYPIAFFYFFLAYICLFILFPLDGFLYLEDSSFQKIDSISRVCNNSSNILEGNLMIQNVTQVCKINRPAGNHLRHGMSILFNTFNSAEFNKPLYCLTLPGLVSVACGVYMNFNFLQTFYPGGSLNLGSAVLMLILPFFGIFMAFTGILLHSITGLIRYKMHNP